MKIKKKDIIEAQLRINNIIHQTPVLKNQSINRITNTSLFFKCENFQKVGAFKMRGASNVIFSKTKKEKENGFATHSSGNHPQAVALASKLAGTKAHIVMPNNAPEILVVMFEIRNLDISPIKIILPQVKSVTP